MDYRVHVEQYAIEINAWGDGRQLHRISTGAIQIPATLIEILARDHHLLKQYEINIMLGLENLSWFVQEWTCRGQLQKMLWQH